MQGDEFELVVDGIDYDDHASSPEGTHAVQLETIRGRQALVVQSV